jgi:hypothetical protein
MTSWILQHFLNPAFFWPGLALLAAPIIIHLINRLRYRRVRFAAMEFLLASQKRNRRRVLFEQFLLLLLRMTLVLLVVALLARLILDPEQLSLFQGAKSHHVVILDDSASMLDRTGDRTDFDEAKDVVRRIAAEGARRPGTQLLTLLVMSAPDTTVSGLSERTVDEALLAEVTERLDVLNCTHQSVDPAAALETARQRLWDERSAVRNVHVISDFRKVDWIDNKGALALLKSLDQANIGVNLVRCVEETHENMGIVDLGGAVDVAAAGVPVSLSGTVRNWGTREAQNVSASIFIDDVRLPRTIDFRNIRPGETATEKFDVQFQTPQPHRVRLSLAEDALEVDNDRSLAIDVPVDNPVLVVDGSPGTEQAQYVADALAADKSVTGFAPDVRVPEDLRRVALDQYPLIYLINVPEMPPDAIAALDQYVRRGGGLIWYLGDAVRPAFYNERLFQAEGGLFPVRLGPAPLELDQGSVSTAATISSRHELFAKFYKSDVPILDQVLINYVYALSPATDSQPNVAKDVEEIAEVSGHPLLFEHKLDKGRIVTCLTSAGPLASPDRKSWTNWANGPAGFSFVVLQLDLATRLIRKDRAFPQLATGSPLELDFNQATYQPDVDIVTPDDRVHRVQASRVEPGNEDEMGEAALRVSFRETDEPGIYTAVLMGQDQTPDRRLYALNVPPREGALEIIQEPALLNELGSETSVRIQPAGSFEWIRSESPGSEVRWLLLVLLAVFSILEQALASRLSYHAD